jgi:hypothetical protein
VIRFETPPQRTACPVAKKAIFENRESDQLVARLDNANFGLDRSGLLSRVRELNADGLSAPPNNVTKSALAIALLERQFKAVRHLGRHGRYDLCPVLRDVHDLTFLIVMTRQDDPRRQMTGASNFAF